MDTMLMLLTWKSGKYFKSKVLNSTGCMHYIDARHNFVIWEISCAPSIDLMGCATAQGGLGFTKFL